MAFILQCIFTLISFTSLFFHLKQRTFTLNLHKFSPHLPRTPSLIYFGSKLVVLPGILLATLLRNFMHAYIVSIIWQINKFGELDTQSIWSTCPFNSEFYATDIMSIQRFIFNFFLVASLRETTLCWLIVTSICLQITKLRVCVCCQIL